MSVPLLLASYCQFQSLKLCMKIVSPILTLSSNLKLQAQGLSCGLNLSKCEKSSLLKRFQHSLISDQSTKSLLRSNIHKCKCQTTLQSALLRTLSSNIYGKYHQMVSFNCPSYGLTNVYNFNGTRSYSQKKPSTYKPFAKQHESFKNVLSEKQNIIGQAQQNLRRSGRLLLDDIKETKSKMKIKMGEIIERENIWTIPNMLCVTRILASPYLGYVIVNNQYTLALALVVCAGITDLLDGLIARNFKGQSSKLGSFLDPMADKVLVSTLFLSLTFAGNMPVPLTALIVSRDIILVLAGSYVRYLSLPAPRTLSRYFDLTHATVQLKPTLISKINTTVQLVTVLSTLGAAVAGYDYDLTLQTLWWLTAATTVGSAMSYIFSKDTYRILKKKF